MSDAGPITTPGADPYRTAAPPPTAGVRCEHCFTLSQGGQVTCPHCTRPLSLEPVAEPTNEPCPRCRTPLGRIDRYAECERCRGLFVAHLALRSILGEHRAPAPGRPSVFPTASRLERDVRYLPCPTCGALMSRRNFADRSGIVVDVCAKHGTWLDAGELTALVDFAEAGGLADAERRAAERAHEAARAERQLSAIRGPFEADDAAEGALLELLLGIDG